MSKGEFSKAVPALQSAAEMEPHNVQFQQDWLVNRASATEKLLAKAETAKQLGQTDQAAAYLNEILGFDRNNARALAGLDDLAQSNQTKADIASARAAMARKDWGDAEVFLKRAAERAPDSQAVRSLRRDLLQMRTVTTPMLPNLGSMYRKPINLDFRDAGLKMVFDALSRTTNINFIFDRDVKVDQRTTLSVKQTTLEDAIDVILSTNQLEKKILNSTSVLIYPNTAAKTREYQDLMVKAFYMSNVDAKIAANLLKSVLKLKEVYVDEKYHMLVLREPAETIALAEKLLALQDLEEPEVMIEVEVLEVNRNNLLNLGIQVSNQLTISPLTNGQTSNSGLGATTQTYRLSDLKNLDSTMLGITLPSATLSAQKTDGSANLLANPRLRVKDRDKAKILIGDKVPVVTTTTTPNGFLSENIQYLDVGLKLDVEPEIHLRDEISLKLALEVSSIVSAIKTSTGTQAYQIGTRNFSSSLRLRDGETQILAGLISDADRTDANRIPLLGDVPVLGRLFSSQKDDHQKTEIVLSITPHLIRNIQRQGATSEAFWSGTESNLSTRMIQVRDFQPENGVASTTDQRPTAANSAQEKSPQDTLLSWSGPSEVHVGETFKLELRCTSKDVLRALPLQLSTSPKVFDVVAVTPGRVFAPGNSNDFSSRVDVVDGTVSVTAATKAPEGVAGDGLILTLELKANAASSDAQVAISAATPIGLTKAIQRPVLPIVHQIAVIK